MTGDPMYSSNYPPQPRRTPGWAVALIVVGAVMVLACGGLMIVGALADDKQRSITPIGTAGSASPPASTPVASPAVPAGPRTEIGEGTYEVGTEVAPGKYKSAGAKPGAFQFCGWDVKEGGRTIDLGSANEPTEQQLVTLKAGQVFESSGCHTWVKVG